MHPFQSRRGTNNHGNGARTTTTTTIIAPMLASTTVAMAIILALCLVALAPPVKNAVVIAFVPASCNSIGSSSSSSRRFDRNVQHERSYLSMSTDSNGDQNDDSEDGDQSNNETTTNNKNTNNDNDTTKNNNNENDDNGLSWRLAKLRLEEANTSRLLKRKPLKLPYATSQKWIQQNWAIQTKEEFEDLVANGNLRTPYISKRPEEYYGKRGEWISWDHYLLGDCSVDDEGGVSGRNSTHLKWA